MLAILKQIGKILWLAVGGAILLWMGYLVHKVYTVPSPGIRLFVIFLLMMGIAMATIYIIITITGKIISFSVKKRKK